MIDRFLNFLRSLPGRPEEGSSRDTDDSRLAATALLFHVMDADGVRHRQEVEQLSRLLRGTYRITAEELHALMAAGEQADREAVDFHAFTRVLERHLDIEQRREFIRIMWEIVYADGELHELEDSIVWRVAELIGVERRDRVELRRAAARTASASRGKV
jgi:uncharacterized tellurite resistance protein B-like protein